MPNRSLLEEVAACPSCSHTGLRRSFDSLTCPTCGTPYPLLGGIPWLLREPSLALGEWQNRLRLYLEEFRDEERAVRRELALPLAGDATRHRLNCLADAYHAQAAAVERLLSPLSLRPLPAPRATLSAFAVEVPRHQDLHSYYVNLHRDWVWGEEENEQARDAVTSVLPAGRAGRALVLGAGGCRLAFDLHQQGTFGQTVALDINPLLLFASAELFAGRAVELHEFPLAPRTTSDHAIARRLTAPARPREGLELVFGDALAAPFAEGAFDVVLTPWLADIVDDEFASFALRINRLLRPEGVWVNFGSLSFPGIRPSQRIGFEEVMECVAAAGFVVDRRDEREIPYMRSPASRHSRMEVVLTYAARKALRAPEPPPAAKLPVWLTNPQAPIPVSAHFEVTAIASRLQAFVLTLIDGRRSAADLASFVVQQNLLGPESALAAVRGLLLRLYDSERRQPPGV